MQERERVLELIEQSVAMSNGLSRVAVAEEAVRRADSVGERELQYDSRMQLVAASIFAGFPEKALVAFGWLSATSDEDPEAFPASRAYGQLLLGVDLLWCYKWVVQNTPVFSQISREQIEDTLDEMQRRFREEGYSMRPVWMNRGWVGMELGDPPEQLGEIYEQFRQAPRDAYADCEACEQNFHVDIQRYLGDWESAVREAEPLLTGVLGCAEVPHVTISMMMMEFWERGDRERAASLHRRGYEMCHANRDFLEELAEHVDYRVVTGDLAGALELAERHLPWVHEARAGKRRWRWFVSLGELFRAVATVQETVSLRIPEGLGLDSESPHDPTSLADWFDARADELVRQFDARNGNDFLSSRGREIRDRLRRAAAPATD